MIRRRVYLDAGEYDRRLVNLQDLDMWIRICTRAKIHVLPECLTAFRIHTDARNLSAPRRDTALRSQFEYSQILKRYRSLEPSLLRDIFADETATFAPLGDNADRFLCEVALTVESPAHRLFAMQTLFDAAAGSEGDLHRLKELAGSINVFGLP